MHPNDDEGTAAFFTTPEALMEHRRQLMDLQHMSGVESQRSVDRLMDELTAEQLFTLYRIFCLVQTSPVITAEYFVGVVATTMRLKHQLCTACGNPESEHDSLLPKVGSEIVSEPGRKFEFSEEDRQLSVKDLLAKYNLESDMVNELDHTVGPVRCLGCETIFMAIQTRIEQGPTCPVCVLNAKDSDGKTDSGTTGF